MNEAGESYKEQENGSGFILKNCIRYLWDEDIEVRLITTSVRVELNEITIYGGKNSI